MVVLHNSSTVSDRWHRGTLPHELTHKYSPPPHLLSGPIHDCTVKIDMGPEMASRDLVTLFLRAENFQRRIQMESTITINQALKNKALIHWLLLVLLSWAFFLGVRYYSYPALPALSSLLKSFIWAREFASQYSNQKMKRVLVDQGSPNSGPVSSSCISDTSSPSQKCTK